MSRFGSSISYHLVDLIDIYKTYGENKFEEMKISYLKSQNVDKNSKDYSFYYGLDADKIKKVIDFIDKYIDCLTPENELKMETYFNNQEPAFIDDLVNTKIFNFTYADKIYNFAKEKGIDIRIHTIVWYRHIPRQLIEYVKDKNPEDKKRLTYEFIKTYMDCLAKRYPDAYAVDVINELAIDPDELNYLKIENIPLPNFDEDGIRIDFWYETLGKNYYIEIYKMAREVFGSSVKLFYNDNNEGSKEKRETYLKIIKNIRDFEEKNKMKILDGFGMQCHFWGDETETRDYIKDNLDFYSNLGLDIQITEFDVSNHSSKEVQNSIFRNFIDVVKNYDIDTFTMWGLNDEFSWISWDNPVLVNKNFDLKDFAYEYTNHFSNKQRM